MTGRASPATSEKSWLGPELRTEEHNDLERRTKG